MAASGHIKDSIGYFGNFTLGMVLALIAMLYAIFILKVRPNKSIVILHLVVSFQ